MDKGKLHKNWMLASSMSSFSRPHIDTSGYATVVHIISGSKLWLLQCTSGQTDSIPSSDEWDLKATKWCAAHLLAGDILYVCLLIGGSQY